MSTRIGSFSLIHPIPPTQVGHISSENTEYKIYSPVGRNCSDSEFSDWFSKTNPECLHIDPEGNIHDFGDVPGDLDGKIIAISFEEVLLTQIERQANRALREIWESGYQYKCKLNMQENIIAVREKYPNAESYVYLSSHQEHAIMKEPERSDTPIKRDPNFLASSKSIAMAWQLAANLIRKTASPLA